TVGLAHGQAGRDQIALRRLVCARFGNVAVEQRAYSPGISVAGLVAELRVGNIEPGFTWLRCHARPTRRSHQRRSQLVERIHAGDVSRHSLSRSWPTDPEPRFRIGTQLGDATRAHPDG